MKQKAYRHGELLFIEINKLPNGVTKSKTNIVATGSHGNNHVAVNCDLYMQKSGEYTIGYLKAKKDNKLQHPDHGEKSNNPIKECSLPEGIYEIRTQFEVTNSGMVQVID